MKTLRLEEVSPGMVLARDVKGRFGRGILATGNIITEKHIFIFKSWGVTEIIVENRPPVSRQAWKEGLNGSAQFELVERKLREKFKFTDPKHPAIKELFQVSFKRKMNLQVNSEN
ncbi:MAG: hypothetical protein GWN61_23425 [candidate division Zixibacteria bacterium]|nr:hypothetical protein [candidate division KSB1 bacterium]NIR67546.1 hypothetical protein [candidate division Zixibacteria bacterium]NIS45196.1 hypothetical protein [candidate division Zixibacteria bacterium]NIT72103.1 hypothetical protein [candidate division KSB1 bacterium]NIU12974.1 hypothetical protein [candidate division Zixibacteria bacterium]